MSNVGMRTMKRSKRVMVGVLAYVALWTVTATLGVHDFEMRCRRFIVGQEKWSGKPYTFAKVMPDIEAVPHTPYRSWHYAVSSPGPFVLRTRSFMRHGSNAQLCKATFLWFLGFSLCLHVDENDQIEFLPCPRDA